MPLRVTLDPGHRRTYTTQTVRLYQAQFCMYNTNKGSEGSYDVRYVRM